MREFIYVQRLSRTLGLLIHPLSMTAGIKVQPESGSLGAQYVHTDISYQPWICLQLPAAGTRRHDRVPAGRVFVQVAVILGTCCMWVIG